MPVAHRVALKDTRPTGHISRGRQVQFSKNRILEALPPEEFRRISPFLTSVQLDLKQSLYKPDQPITQVWFPDSGVCSVMSVMRNGTSAEVGTIGNEGVTGIAVFFGDATEPSESLVQVPGAGRSLPAGVFRREIAQKGKLYQLVSYYAHALMVQVMQSAACNALHPVEQRACKWLLMTHDRVFTNEFMLTHEFLGLMLGVRRQTITVIARNLQRAGFIKYTHGHVTVLNREGLEAGSCECYAIVSKYFDKFLKRLSN
jgi:CRP-like cAMP-binding protein